MDRPDDARSTAMGCLNPDSAEKALADVERIDHVLISLSPTRPGIEALLYPFEDTRPGMNG